MCGGSIVPLPDPEGYLEARGRDRPAPRYLGHDLYLALAQSSEATEGFGIAEIHIPEDPEVLGTPDHLLAEAQKNLAAALRAREIELARFAGPSRSLNESVVAIITGHAASLDVICVGLAERRRRSSSSSD